MNVQLPDGTVLQNVPEGTTRAQIAAKLTAAGRSVPSSWLSPTKKQPSMADLSPTDRAGERITEGIVEPALNLASSAVATPVAGLRGAVDLATGEGVDKAARDVESTERALTYEPRTAAGKAVTGAIAYPFKKLGQAADAAGAKVAQATGSPALGAATNVAVQSIPALVSKGAAMLRGSEAAVTSAKTEAAAEARAHAYVDNHTNLDWSTLSDAFRKTLTRIAHDAKSLDNLDPSVVERQARLTRLGLPATRGQVTRDLAQLTREENLSKTDTGAGIRDINAEQDRILHQNLDTLRGETGGKATTRAQVGVSVQGASRGKLDTLRAEYQTEYANAKKSGATLDPADISPLKEWLSNPTNKRNAGYLTKAIEDYEGRGEKGHFIPKDHVSINNLEEIRKEATANAKKPGPEGHYAKEAVKVIDDILDNSGSNVYRGARAKFRAVKDEFDRQGRVAALVKQKGMSRDRAVALEDTFDSVVLKGSREDLQAVKSTLTEGGTAETRAKGTQAWNDLKAATIDYLKEKAAGKRAIPGEKGQLQFNSTFIEAADELLRDGKLDVLFGPETTTKIQDLMEATRDVRTKPTGRIAGSDTAARVLNFLEKLAAVPGVGRYAAGIARAGQKVASLGQETREAGRAKTTPLDDAAAASAKTNRKAAKEANTLEALRRSGPVAGAYTLQDEGRQ